MHLTVPELQAAIDRMRECNPMLGLRGCRLGIVSPELVEMQSRAIFEAALDVKARGKNPIPKIMVPLVGTVAEFQHQANIIRTTAAKVFEERGQSIEFSLGSMIETPRAAVVAFDIAKAGAEFFSYGTNDLTQMTFGYSRDDVGVFLARYLSLGILPADPFGTIDTTGVGKLIELASREGRRANPNLKMGVCGEHGGDPDSVKFFCTLDHNYASCSPFRVPLARLAAAQAAIEQGK